MKVKFIGLNEGESDAWLIGGNVYVVLAITIDRNGVDYRIVSGKSLTPALFPAASFIVVDQKVPKNWIADVRKGGAYMELSPFAWTQDGFWDRFFDNDPDAIAVFERESNAITSEE